MELRILNDELKKIAKEELQEEDDRIEEDVKCIREWLKKQPHITAREEKQWLVTFLRGCKYSLERTKEKIDMYYTVRNLVPEYLQNRDPFSPGIQRLLEVGPCLPLPKLEHSGSPRVMLMRAGVYDGSKTKLEDLFKLFLMIHDILLNEDDNFIVAGEVAVIEMKDIGMGHIMMITPAQLKKAMTCFQQAYPLRIKGGHFINPTSAFETLYGLMKLFATEKIKKRLCVYSQKSYKDLYKVVPKDTLPEEYGGKGGKLADITAHWKAKVESYSEWFKADSKFKTDEKKRPGEPKTTEAIFGLEGSFRKLNVD